MLATLPLLVLAFGPVPQVIPPAPYTLALAADAKKAEPLVKTPWVKDWLAAAGKLQAHPMALWYEQKSTERWQSKYFTADELKALSPADRAKITERWVNDDDYYGRYSTPVAYARAFDL